MAKELYFSKVRLAREAFRGKALELFDNYQTTVKLAIANQDYEVALKAIQWAIEHMPAEDDGTRMLDASIDKDKSGDAKPAGPQINIGFQLGGISGGPKALEPVIDIQTLQLESGDMDDEVPIDLASLVEVEDV